MGSLAERIRSHANKAFIEPARRAGRTETTIVAGDVHRDLKLDNRMPAVCAALDALRFQHDYGVLLSTRTGPQQAQPPLGASACGCIGRRRDQFFPKSRTSDARAAPACIKREKSDPDSTSCTPI